MISVSSMVMTNRGFDETDKKKMQMLTRVDFLRDDRVRMATFSEIYPDKMQILEYKCQTLYYNLIYTFPINLIVQDKNVGSYQEHFTSALRGERFSKENNYMTTSIWAELISNFGIILGSVLMFVLIMLVARYVEFFRHQQALSSMLLAAFVMINMFTFAYIIMYLEFLLFLCYNVRNNKAEFNK